MAKIVMTSKKVFDRTNWISKPEIQGLIINLAYAGFPVTINCEPVTKEWYLVIQYGFEWNGENSFQELNEYLKTFSKDYSFEIVEE